MSTKKSQPTIELVFKEKLIKSLNKIQQKQNHELLKIISEEKIIPIVALKDFVNDQRTKAIHSKE